MDVDGEFVVAWQSAGRDGSGDGVFAQRCGDPIVLDIDGNGAAAALTDGLLVLRYRFGFTETSLTVGGALETVDCIRCEAAAIEDCLAGIT